MQAYCYKYPPSGSQWQCSPLTPGKTFTEFVSKYPPSFAGTIVCDSEVREHQRLVPGMIIIPYLSRHSGNTKGSIPIPLPFEVLWVSFEGARE